MIYSRDLLTSFEKICEKLDAISIFVEKPSLRIRLIEFRDLLFQLKLLKERSFKIVNMSEIDNFKQAILKYEANFEILISLNDKNFNSLYGNYIYVTLRYILICYIINFLCLCTGHILTFLNTIKILLDKSKSRNFEISINN
jgi:hypothetical protein